MLKPGTELRNRYKIVRVIGRGGMGNVYLAEDLRLPGRRCAVKEVRYSNALPPEWQQELRMQFLREATVLARLDHPNLPKVSDYFSEEEADYLVMDYVPGKDLLTLMYEAQSQGRFLDEEDVLAWADQLLDALHYLHTQNPPIVHRDIKPSNVKVTPTGLVKLVDFGLVKEMVLGEATITVIQGKGTLPYTPLEQYGSEPGQTDPRSDIYAFGATLYHLLTGKPPLTARERFLQPERFEPPRKINPRIRPEVERAILWAMSLHPDERPANVLQLRAALFGTMALPHSRWRTPTQVPWKQYAVDVALLVLAILGVAIAVWTTLVR